MKIVHVIAGLDPRAGGPTSAVVGMADSQQSAGLNVSVLYTFLSRDDGGTAERLKSAGVEVYPIGPCRGPLASHPTLTSTIRDAIRGAGVVHVHGLWEEIQHRAARECRAAGKPYVVSPHGMLTPWSLSQKRWKKRLYMALRLRKDLNAAAALHFTTAAERDAVLGSLRWLRPAPIVEPLGIHLEEFESAPSPGKFRREYPQLGDRPFILLLGRLHPVKGLDLLVPAFARAGLPPEMSLVVVGPDPDGYRATIERLARAEGVSDRLLFTGMLSGRKRIEALADAELFCLPSYHENFGVAVIEALAAGIPVVISDQVSIYREVVAAGVGAAVPNKIEPLAAELRRWIADPALRRTASQKARAFALDRYGWPRIAARWRDHYQRLTGSEATQGVATPAPESVNSGQ